MLRRIIGLVLVAVVVSATASAQERLKPGETFRDCPTCPELVVIPAGSFMMGAAPGEEAREEVPDETRRLANPRHRVTIGKSFAMGKYEVTRAEFAAFVRDSRYSATGECWYWDPSDWGVKKDSSHSWRDPGFSQTDSHPVTCVSWVDAKAYVGWLARKTGNNYRLPSEAEWEYAARAGTMTARYWGDGRSGACDNANVSDRTRAREHNLAELIKLSKQDRADFIFMCGDGYVYTAPVGRFRANGFGLYDALGNVWDWVEDCWNESYAGAPTDGSAWTKGTCAHRVSRGGSWIMLPGLVRAASRFGQVNGDRFSFGGFRVARTLP